MTRAEAVPAGTTTPVPTRVPAAVLLVGGVVGLVAAFVLTVEKIALIADPAYLPSCSINPVLSCGSVMVTPQASVFGFPNPLLGVAGFAVVAATGAALAAGARLRGWYWAGLQVGVTAGVVFVHWLMFQSLYRIGALCPYCMVVWAAMIPIFLHVTLRNAAAVAHRLPAGVRTVVDAAVRLHGVVLTVWVLGVLGAILQRFWTFWSLLAGGG